MPTQRTTGALLAVSLALGAASAAAWLGDAARRRDPAPVCAQGEPHRRIELIFGLSRKGRPDIGDAEWRQFLDREVTPRFADGLTVLAAEGQWRDAAGLTVKEPSRYLLVWARSSADLDARIEAIRTAWKREHGQESVLRAESRDCVSF